MPIYSSASDNEMSLLAKLFGLQRPMHDVLGGGKVADVLLWRDRKISAALLTGMTLIWLLFEVVEYNFVTLFCHLSITLMLIVFIWCNGAQFFNWTPPRIPKSSIHEQSFQQFASSFHARFNWTLGKLLHIACGREPALFFLALLGLYVLSVIGNYFTSLNFLYMGYLCLQTLPFLYDRYEEEVDYYFGIVNCQAKETYRKFDSRFLKKIPRGPRKEKKDR